MLSVNILYNLTLKLKLSHVPYGSTLILECNFFPLDIGKSRDKSVSQVNNAPYSCCERKETSAAWEVSVPFQLSPNTFAVKVLARHRLQTPKTVFGFKVLTTTALASHLTALTANFSQAPFSTQEPSTFIFLPGSPYGNAFLRQKVRINL